MESHGADINEKPHLVPGGKQRILMDGYQIPLDINNGLAYLRCRLPTTHELETLPHIIMTADIDWNPSIFDNNIDDVETFFDTKDDIISHGPFDHSTGSMVIKLLPSTALAANQTTLMQLSSWTTMTWLMICLTFGILPMFAVHTA
jgi:hypothetical protein